MYNKIYIFLLLILIAYLYFNLCRSKSIGEGFTQSTRNDEIYAKLHSTVFNDQDFIDYDCSNIIQNIDQSVKKGYGKPYILDAGCGAGHHYKKLFRKYGKDSIVGVDNNKTILKQAKVRVPTGTFKEADLQDKSLFKDQTFTHIVCSVDTIHHNHGSKMMDIISNFYNWLKPGGLLMMHIFNNKDLDPAPRSFSQYYHDDQGNKHALTYFEDFSHDAWWEAKKGDLYVYKEKIITEEENKKEVGNIFYIPDKEVILKKTEVAEFKLKDIVELSKIDVKFDLYIFQK